MMSHFSRLARAREDSGILKYFWFFVFLLHIVFLGMGIYWLNEGYKLIDFAQFSKRELRIDNLFISMYMLSIAFSLILAIISIYVYVLHSRQVQMLRLMHEFLQTREDGKKEERSSHHDPGSQKRRR